MNEYKTITSEAVGEITEKKSRFIATLRPVASEEEAVAFIAEMKKKYWDARHNCSAYIIVADKTLERCSDDGEPSRTAGMPMLEVLKGAGLQNIAAVVTRYFGGILLGTGGLVRAYQAAVSEAVAQADVRTMRQLMRVEISTDYNGYGRLQYFTSQEGITIADCSFTDSVTAVCYMDDAQLGSISKKMTEATAGKCIIEAGDRQYVLV